MYDWNDLKHLLAVARCGSTLAAAKALGVNQSTVHRRLTELERRMGVRLVRRLPTGYRLTEAGEALLPAATAVEDGAQELERQVRAFKDDLTGSIRLTCPEPIVGRLSEAGFVDRFEAAHPGLRIAFVTSDRYVDLSAGEADVAFRSGDPADMNLVGRKIADSVWAVYASRTYVERHGRPNGIDDLARHPLVALDGAMAGHRLTKWLAEVAPDATIAAHSSSILGLLATAKSGIGLTPLPTTIAEGEDSLVQVLPPVSELTRGWHVLTHPDLRTLPRIAAFLDFVIEDLPALRRVFMG